jgi:hypothetical protein
MDYIGIMVTQVLITKVIGFTFTGASSNRACPLEKYTR